MYKLSPNFTLDEFTFSETAVRLGVPNVPPKEILDRLHITAQNMEHVRAELGHPVAITSGYRSREVNRLIGGSVNSAHCDGWAADFVCRTYGDPYQVCLKLLDSGIKFDQLIMEYGRWAHISCDPRERMQALTIFNKKRGYVKGILTIGEYENGA